MSWKKYGGIQQLSKANNLNVNSVITDTLTLRNNYDGNFQINGSLIVRPDDSSSTSEINNNLDVSGNLIVRGEVEFRGDINPSKVEVSERFNVTASGETILQGKVLFDSDDVSTNTFMFGTKENIGVNTLNPEYTFDLRSNQTKMIRFVSKSEQVENVIIQNSHDYGIVFTTDNSANMIKFFHEDVSYNNEDPAAYISYDPSGQMIHDVSQNIQFHTKKVIIGKDNVNTNDEATAVIYDNTENPELFLSHIDISRSTTSGVALKLISNDTSSNTFMKVVNRDNIGWNYGGGNFPFDSERNMGSIGWTDICSTNYVFDEERYIPSQTIVSGTSLVNTRATTGFNTFKPKTEQCVMDVNGPMKIGHNEIHQTAVMPFQLNSLSISKTGDFSIAVGNTFDDNGNYYFLTSDTNGKKWESIIQKDTVTALIFKAYVCDSSFAIVYSSNQSAYYYTNNSFSTLEQSKGSEPGNDNCRYVFKYPSDDNNNPTIYRVFIFEFGDSYSEKYWDFSLNDNGEMIGEGNVGLYNINPIDVSNIHIYSIDGTNTVSDDIYYFYLAGGDNTGQIIKWGHTRGSAQNSVENDFYINTDISAYVSIKKVGNNLIAVGDNYITTTGDDISFTDISFSVSDLSFVSFNDAFIYDSSCAMIVGDNAVIYYSNDYLNQQWTRLTSDDVDTMGNANSLFDVSNNIKTVHIDGSYNFIFGCETRQLNGVNQSKIFYCHFPRLFYPESSPLLLDVNGNMNIGGNLTGASSLKLFPTTDIIQMGSTDCSLSVNAIDTNTILLDSNPVLQYTDIDSITKNDKHYTKKITIGGDGILIDVAGYLNLLDASNTNVQGGEGGEGVTVNDVNTEINAFYARDISDVYSVKYDETNPEVSKTSSKYLFINYNPPYNENRQTAGAGLYIYNDISSDEGIAVDQQLRDGYIRISKHKSDSTVPKQDSFSFRATGQEESVRLNIKKLKDNCTDVNKKTLMFTNALTRSENFDNLTDACYNSLDVFEDDNVEIAVDSSYPYIDIDGHLHTNNLDFFTRDISMSGKLYANDASFNGNVFISTDLSVNGDLYVNDISMTGKLFANDASFNGNVFISTDLSVNGDLYVDDISMSGKLFANDASFNGNVFISTDLSVNGDLYVDDISMSGKLFANDASFNGNVFISTDLSVNGDLYVENILYLKNDGNVLEVSGNTFTSAEICNILTNGTGFNGGDLSANNADFSGNVSISDKLVIGGSGEILDTEGVLTVVSNTLSEKAFVIKTARNDGYSGHNRLWFSTNLSGGTYNDMTVSGDFGLFFNDDDFIDTSNGLVIAPWSDTSGASDFETVPVGIRISRHSIDLGTNHIYMFKRGTTTRRLAFVAGGGDALVINYSGNNDDDDYYTGGVQIGSSNNPVPTIINGTCTILQSCSATSFNSTSDYRVKSNIESLTIRENAIDHLRPVQYTLNSSGETQIGFIAHELQEHYPELVSGTKDGEEMQQINYVGMIPVLVKEIQQLRQRVSDLESRL